MLGKTLYVGHFTALVWKNTRYFGCAMGCASKDGKGVHLVCQYSESGNLKSSNKQDTLLTYEKNVFPGDESSGYPLEDLRKDIDITGRTAALNEMKPATILSAYREAYMTKTNPQGFEPFMSTWKDAKQSEKPEMWEKFLLQEAKRRRTQSSDLSSRFREA